MITPTSEDSVDSFVAVLDHDARGMHIPLTLIPTEDCKFIEENAPINVMMAVDNNNTIVTNNAVVMLNSE